MKHVSRVLLQILEQQYVYLLPPTSSIQLASGKRMSADFLIFQVEYAPRSSPKQRCTMRSLTLVSPGTSVILRGARFTYNQVWIPKKCMLRAHSYDSMGWITVCKTTLRRPCTVTGAHCAAGEILSLNEIISLNDTTRKAKRNTRMVR